MQTNRLRPNPGTRSSRELRHYRRMPLTLMNPQVTAELDRAARPAALAESLVTCSAR
jgi:hypothetical protein